MELLENWFTFKKKTSTHIKECINSSSTVILQNLDYAKDSTHRNNLLSNYVLPTVAFVTRSHIKMGISAAGYLTPSLVRLTLQIFLLILL